jgi:peptidoglycan/LPS O-acetylase OafA/YrhL
LFFVISGFVMGFVYGGRIGTVSEYGGFLWRRVARLYPLHVAVLALNIAFWAILLTRGSSDAAPSFAPGCIVSTALLIQEYVNCGSRFTFNGVTWSISVEMGMYVIFPALIFLANRSRGWLLFATALAIVLALFLIPPGRQWVDMPDLARGLAGFSVGYLLFRAQELIPDIPRSDLLVIALSTVALAEMVLDVPQLVVLATLVALAATAISADRHDRIHPIVEKLSPLGQLTYSMYIWHRLIVLAFMNVVADKLFRGNVTVLVAMTVLTYIAIFVVSYVGYFTIEVPARRALIGWLHNARKGFPSPKSPPTGL